MTDPGYTHISVLLDRSGSMFAIKEDTEGGFATFIKDQQSNPGRATITLGQFDAQYEEVYAARPVQNVPPLDLQPRGMTALLDATARIIQDTGSALSAMDEDKRPGQVVILIMTDGQENSSREQTFDSVKQMVERQEQVYGWRFVYIGANQDAIKVGASLGIPKSQTLTYDTSNTAGTYATASASVTRTRTGQDAGFTEAERSQVGSSR